ncbi:hypothetical protein [Calothrix sp. PCC 7507]|uniref:hypothetical protein n=1 Tax=Calothrix sp. PCC 7507 TaxID=99598 RepID=UPI00029F349C|nr:hypothetical protein [Calothrix sp. PCC 7507]AFY34447.1 hypothetical protein Cal7507_4063 [Calothrix sp. PCC 7507]
MSDRIININEAFELYEQELDAVTGGKNVPPITGSYPREDVRLVAESSADSALQSVNRITNALHLIYLNI